MFTITIDSISLSVEGVKVNEMILFGGIQLYSIVFIGLLGMQYIKNRGRNDNAGKEKRILPKGIFKIE